jgi:hypothetical protein
MPKNYTFTGGRREKKGRRASDVHATQVAAVTEPDEVLAVVFQFCNRFADIRQSRVVGLLDKAFCHLWFPAAAEFLQVLTSRFR